MSIVTSSRTSLFLKLLACVCAGLLVTSLPADAAKKPQKHASAKKAKWAKKAPKAKGGGYAPPYAALVIDAKTGKILFSDSADETRHPASLTKVMTLYLLFDELERGAVSLKTPLTVSAEAARQAPSKLGLKPGETITVENAIQALVTKSANDVAVTVAENIAGSEPAFAQRMTRKARALGMSGTVYRNASGLPDPGQITTARDLVTLGRAIQDNHPNYYGYFSTRSFAWRGQSYSNHNKLLGGVKGVDGIKTGYVRASGFNLLTSAQQDGRKVVAVVLGGKSSSSRDAHMRELVQANLPRASGGPRTAPLVAEAPLPPEPLPALATARASAPSPAPQVAAPLIAAVPLPAPRPAARAPAQPVLPQPVLAAIAASAPVAQPVAAPQPVQLAQVDGATASSQTATNAVATASPRSPTLTPDAIARRVAVANAMVTTTPTSNLGWMVGAAPVAAPAYAGTTPRSPRPQTIAVSGATASLDAATPIPPAPAPAAKVPAPEKIALPPAPAAPVQTAANQTPVRAVRTVSIQPPVEAGLYPAPIPAAPQPVAPQMAAVTPVVPARAEAALAASAPPRAGWMIQIAATPDMAQAKQLLERAAGPVKAADRKAEPYTEPVQKDGVTLYRARFAGLSEQSAVQACKAIKRASMSCFTLKN